MYQTTYREITVETEHQIALKKVNCSIQIVMDIEKYQTLSQDELVQLIKSVQDQLNPDYSGLPVLALQISEIHENIKAQTITIPVFAPFYLVKTFEIQTSYQRYVHMCPYCNYSHHPLRDLINTVNTPCFISDFGGHIITALKCPDCGRYLIYPLNSRCESILSDIEIKRTLSYYALKEYAGVTCRIFVLCSTLLSKAKRYLMYSLFNKYVDNIQVKPKDFERVISSIRSPYSFARNKYWNEFEAELNYISNYVSAGEGRLLMTDMFFEV